MNTWLQSCLNLLTESHENLFATIASSCTNFGKHTIGLSNIWPSKFVLWFINQPYYPGLQINNLRDCTHPCSLTHLRYVCLSCALAKLLPNAVDVEQIHRKTCFWFVPLKAKVETFWHVGPCAMNSIYHCFWLPLQSSLFIRKVVKRVCFVMRDKRPLHLR